LHASFLDATNFPKEGEVWVAILGKNIGSEINGGLHNFSRPVLVVKKFSNQIYWAVPLSTKQKSLDFYLNFTDVDGQKVALILAQLRLINIRRFRRKVYDIAPEIFRDIRQRLIGYLT